MSYIRPHKLIPTWRRYPQVTNTKKKYKKVVAFYCGTCYAYHMTNEIMKNLKSIEGDLRRRLGEIEVEETTIRSDLLSIKRMIARYEGQLDIEFKHDVVTPRPASISAGAGDPIVVITKTLKQHILEALSDYFPRALRARHLRMEVTKRGYVSEAQSFEGAMFAMLSNLKKKELIESAGKGLYRAMK